MSEIFHPHSLPSEMPCGARYYTRFAQSKEDIEAVLRLRYRIFNEELGEGLAESEATGMDKDRFDDFFHHLLVLTTENEIIGTYRMQTAEMAAQGAGFYSEDEYDLSFFPVELYTSAIEVGRACIAKAHRNGRVLFLLWKGLMRYVLHNKQHLFFGCCSLTSQDPEEGIAMYAHLKKNGHVFPDFSVPPHEDYACCIPEGSLRTSPRVKIPQLMKIYLNYGAKICSPPAVDRKFKTIDFLTLLDINNFDEKTYNDFAN